MHQCTPGTQTPAPDAVRRRGCEHLQLSALLGEVGSMQPLILQGLGTGVSREPGAQPIPYVTEEETKPRRSGRTGPRITAGLRLPTCLQSRGFLVGNAGENADLELAAGR